jgi:tetratricopeptide (TPR) repeat protein
MGETNLNISGTVGKNVVVGDHNTVIEVSGDLIFNAAQAAALKARDLRKMLRVLVVLASPVFDPRNPGHRPSPLDLLAEWRRLADAVSASGAPIALIRLTPPTLEALRYALSPRAVEQGLYPHVLHFSGHAWPEGLLFEDQYGGMDAVSTPRLLAELRDCPPLDLAVFNACQSSEYAFSAAQAFSASGRARAAIGHPDPVRDDEAIQFTASLYAELARGGYPLAEAFQRASRQVSTHAPQRFGDGSLAFSGLQAGEPLVEDNLPPGNLPSRNTFFFGRGAELHSLARMLDETPHIGVLSGVSGIGKTSLALEAAHRNAWRFPGGMAFGDGRGAPSAEFILRGMASALELPAQPGQAPEEALAALARQQPTLFVLDNLEDLPAPDLARLASFLRRLGRGSAALVTLRPPAPIFEDLPAARPIPLRDGLALEDAARYVHALAGRHNAPSLQRGDLAARLAHACGGHPLILEQVVALARKRPLAHMLESIQSLGEDYLKILRMVLDWSLEALDDEKAREALACLPIFGAGSCTPAALAAALDMPPGVLYPLADKLREAALLVFDPRYERYEWHASVSDYARAALRLPDFDARCQRALAQICDVFDNLPSSADPSTRPDLLNDLLNLSLRADWAAEQPDGEPLARLATSPRNWWVILSYHTAWRGWLEKAIEKPIQDRRLKANVRKAIGDVQQFRDDRDAALVSYNEALKLLEIGDKLGEANVYQSLGRMQIFSGQAQEGLQTLQNALTIYGQIGSISGQANILFFVGTLYADNGHLEEGAKLVASAVELGERIDPNHPVTIYMREVLRKIESQKNTSQ